MGAGNREKRKDVAFDGKSVPTTYTQYVEKMLKNAVTYCCSIQSMMAIFAVKFVKTYF